MSSPAPRRPPMPTAVPLTHLHGTSASRSCCSPKSWPALLGNALFAAGKGTLRLQGWTQPPQTAAGTSHPCPQPGQGSGCAPSLQLAAPLARISSCPCRRLSIRPEPLHYPLSDRAQLPSRAQHRSAGGRAAAFHALAASSSWKSPAGPSSRCSPELLLLLLHQPAATAAPGPAGDAAEPGAWGRSHEAVPHPRVLGRAPCSPPGRMAPGPYWWFPSPTPWGHPPGAAPRRFSQLITPPGRGDNILGPAKTNTAPSQTRRAWQAPRLGHPSRQPAGVHGAKPSPGIAMGFRGDSTPQICRVRGGRSLLLSLLGVLPNCGVPGGRCFGPQPLGVQRGPRGGQLGCWLVPRQKVGRSHLQALTIIKPYLRKHLTPLL